MTTLEKPYFYRVLGFFPFLFFCFPFSVSLSLSNIKKTKQKMQFSIQKPHF